MTDKDFYNQGGIRITSSLAIFPGQTYAVRDIASLQVFTTKPNRNGPLWVLIPGILIAGSGVCLFGCCGLGSFGAATDTNRHSDAAPMWVMFFITLCPLLVGIALIALSTWWFASQKPTHGILLCTTMGDVVAYVTTDRVALDEIVAALNKALHAKEQAWASEQALPSVVRASRPPQAAPVIREIERIVERQTLVIRCKHCGNLTAADLSQCQSCGGRL